MSKKGLIKACSEILHSIEQIKAYTKEIDEKRFLENEKEQDSVLMKLLVVGETINKIKQKDPKILEEYNHIPWTKIIGLRNIIAHDYFSVSAQEIWKIATKELNEITPIIKRIKKENSSSIS